MWHRDRYEALFEYAPPGALKGESTPFYLWSRSAQRRIAQEIPGAKFVAVVRDPVDRAYSNWTHLWSDGLEPVGDFLEACDLEPERAAAGWAPFWRYRGLGRYGEQIEHLLTLFPSDQVHVLRYRDLVEDPADTLTRIAKFLEIDPEGFAARQVPSENVSTWVEPTPVNQVLRRGVRTGAWIGQFAPPIAWRTASRPLLKALRGRRSCRPDLTPGPAGRGARPAGRRHQPAPPADRHRRGRLAGSDRAGGVLRQEVVSAVGPGRLVVEAVPAVGQRDDAQVAEAAEPVR